MTLPAVYDLDEYWRQHPPVHLLVAALMDYKAPPPRRRSGPQKPQKPARSADRTPADRSGLEDAPPVEELMAMLGLRKA